MQQGCCDLYGMSVEKSMVLRMGAEMMDPLELMHRSMRPSPAHTGSDNSSGEPPHRSPPTSCENSTLDEPKAKKRRKQSNPLRYQTDERPAEADDQALDLQTAARLRCHHCSGAFETEDALRHHVEEEHVQKVLEKQLQQQQSHSHKTTSCGDEPVPETASKDADDRPLHGMQLVPFEQTRNSPSDNSMQQENGVYKNAHFPFPPMPPPFIPFSRSDDSKSGNLPVPLSMFPNPISPFLFPVLSQGQTPPSSNGNSHSGHGVRIFNLEAYCELCNKEFCNKYFLKTHKANKHGIYSVDSIVSSPYGGPFLSPGLGSPLPLPHLLPTTASDPLPSRTGLFNAESYCEICQKEFCNKYFLKKHRQKIHGLLLEPGQTLSPSTTPSQDAKSNSPVTTTSAPSFVGDRGAPPEEGRDVPLAKMEFPSLFSLQNHHGSGTPVPMPATTATNPASSGTLTVSLQSQGASGENSISHVFTPEKLREMGVINADAFCELCCKEFCNKYFLRTHKLNKHGINMPEISPGKTSSGPPTSHSQGSQSNDKLDMNFDEGRVPEGFLQDHHPGLTFEGIGGELSCDFCNRPFSSLYLLKMHKFYTHNIPYIKEESKSKPNSPTSENNNNQENKENEFIKPHLPLPLPPTSLLSENMQISLQEDAASQDLQKLQSMIRELNASAGSDSNKIVCNLCRVEFDNKYFLRAHMMNEHGVLPNEDGHVPGHGAGDFGLQVKLSDGDFQRLNYTNASVDSEAYCEICQKEFCSKYFLKTHKQNIHGLPVDMSSTPKKSLADEVCQIKTIVNNTSCSALAPLSTNLSSTPHSISIASMPSATAPSSIFSSLAAVSSHTPVAHHPTAGGQNHVTSPQTPTAASHPPATAVPHSPGSSNTVVTSSSSHLPATVSPATVIQSPNVGHLVSNAPVTQMPPHVPGMSLALSLPNSSVNTSTCPSLMTSIAHSPAHPPHLPGLPHHHHHHHHHHPSSLLTPPGGEKPRNLTGRNYCNICNKELCNKYFMKTHMLKMHGINLDSQPHEAARISTIGGVQCDICQKELCSKYFLKVHKQNTHGIYEEGAPGKDHPPFLDKEQPLQGLDLSDPSGRYFSHYPEICPICNCRFKSIKWLKAHMMSDHGNLLKDNFPFNALPAPESNGGGSNNNGSSAIDGSCLCVLCGQGFPDKVALHVHLIKDHQSPTEELGVAVNHSGIKTSTADSSAPTVAEQARVNGNASPVGSQTSPTGPPPKPHGGGGSRIYHCSFCVYSTRWLSNLYAHEKRHTGVNTEGEKKFVCRVCHRAYRYNHSLQRHFLSHRAAGLHAKDLGQPLVLSSHPHFASSLSRPWHSPFKRADGAPPSHKIKRYRCSKCSKKFRSRELCLAHIHAAHGRRAGRGAKPFRCRFCGFATRAWNVLKIHINKQHHNDPVERPPHEEDDDDDDKPDDLSVAGPPAPPDALPPPPPNSPHLPMTFAMPQNPPSAGSFIMQPFLLAQPECDGASARNGTFVPSLVYLPVCQKVAQPVTVAFTLTPA